MKSTFTHIVGIVNVGHELQIAVVSRHKSEAAARKFKGRLALLDRWRYYRIMELVDEGGFIGRTPWNGETVDVRIASDGTRRALRPIT